MLPPDSVIHLIGPGGAGKSTTAPYVAALLGVPVFDLDRAFEVAHGDIDRFLRVHGYAAYAAANVETYLEHGSTAREEAVIRERFALYRQLTSRVVTTMRRPWIAARQVVAAIKPRAARQQRSCAPSPSLPSSPTAS